MKKTKATCGFGLGHRVPPSLSEIIDHDDRITGIFDEIVCSDLPRFDHAIIVDGRIKPLVNMYGVTPPRELLENEIANLIDIGEQLRRRELENQERDKQREIEFAANKESYTDTDTDWTYYNRPPEVKKRKRKKTYVSYTDSGYYNPPPQPELKWIPYDKRNADWYYDPPNPLSDRRVRFIKNVAYGPNGACYGPDYESDELTINAGWAHLFVKEQKAIFLD